MVPGIGGVERVCKCVKGNRLRSRGVLVRLWCASCSHASPKMGRGGILGHDARAFQPCINREGTETSDAYTAHVPSTTTWQSVAALSVKHARKRGHEKLQRHYDDPQHGGVGETKLNQKAQKCGRSLQGASCSTKKTVARFAKRFLCCPNLKNEQGEEMPCNVCS